MSTGKTNSVTKSRNSGQWTEARYRSFVISAIRKAQWPVKYAALRNAEVGKQVNKATGRIAMHYLCSKCSGEFPAKEVQIDHINPVIPVTGIDNYDAVILRAYCEISGFQVLCKPDHRVKTMEENAARRQFKKDQKLTS